MTISTAPKSPNNYPLNNLDWPSILTIAKSKLEKDGYWVFSSGNTDRAALLELAECFGKRKSHVHSDPDGIREVTNKSSSKKSLKQQYTANTNTIFKPHTDGTFLDGIAKTKESSLVYVNPPDIVLMQMVQPAALGGESTILDSQPMLEEALQYDPELVKVLLQPCVVYSRDEQCARASVLKRISRDTWSIRWRYDFATLVEQNACDALKVFYKKYVSNPKYLKHFSLQAGDVVVIDNLRVLHGREAFSDDPEKPRLLRRLWVSTREQVFVNPLGQPQSQRVYEQYQPYSSIEPVEKTKPLISVSTGMQLNPESQTIAETLLNNICFV